MEYLYDLELATIDGYTNFRRKDDSVLWSTLTTSSASGSYIKDIQLSTDTHNTFYIRWCSFANNDEWVSRYVADNRDTMRAALNIFYQIHNVNKIGSPKQSSNCPDCRGTGKYIGLCLEEDCLSCNGSGVQ